MTSIAILPQAPMTLWMADGQLWRSTDSGVTWTVVTRGIPDGAFLVAVDPSVSGALYASNGDLYRSEDGGENWILASAAQDPRFPIRNVVPDPAHPGTVYARSPGLSKSVDYGTTWTSLELPNFNGATVVAVDDRGVVFVGTETFPTHSPMLPSVPLRSADGGVTWLPIADWGVQAGPIGFVTSLATDSEGRLYLGTLANGVWEIGSRTTHVASPR